MTSAVLKRMIAGCVLSYTWYPGCIKTRLEKPTAFHVDKEHQITV
jgi:hypothetical protein